MKDGRPLDGVKVLIVEDEAFIAMAITDKLAEAGADVIDHALTLADAEMAVREDDYQVAILDLRLPDGDANMLARTLTDLGTGIVFHSGHGEIERLKTEFPEARACRKPCRFSEFVDVIREMLGR